MDSWCGKRANRKYGIRAWGAAVSLPVVMGVAPFAAQAQELVSRPGQTESYAIPPGSLSRALNHFAQRNGVVLVFDPAATEGKLTDGLKGDYSTRDGFSALLEGSGLEAVEDGKGGYQVKRIGSPNVAPSKPGQVVIKTDTVNVRALRFKQVGPLPGLALTKEQIAGNIQSISAEEIKAAHALSLSDLMNSKLQSVNVNDYQGNPFQMDVTYRGFTASPQLGTPQGLSVFFDGIRVNEPFGDVVNWDMIPMNALGGFDIFPGSNPLFGLNTLGGALSMKTKSGFTDPGISAEILTGSYGRRQLQASAGINNGDQQAGGWAQGNFAAFGAVNLFLEDGWRDNSPSKVNQAFGKLEWQGERASLSLSSLMATNKLVGNGTVPMELYAQDPAAVFTSPDETNNKLLQFQISGAFDVTDTMSVTGQIYHRKSNRNSTTGDIIDFETFHNSDHSYPMWVTRLPGQGTGLVCGFTDSDSDGVADYYMVSEANYVPFLIKIGSGVLDKSLLTFVDPLGPQLPSNSPVLPDDVLDSLRKVTPNGVWDVFISNDIDPTASLPVGVNRLNFMDVGYGGVPFVDSFGNTSYIFAAPAQNAATCKSYKEWNQGMLPSAQLDRDGNNYINPQPGIVEGTPTAVITNSNIQQSAKGAALQLNWNLDQHKFMVGASVDKSYASYIGKQRLALLDDKRNVYSDPSQLGEEFWVGSHDVTINDFDGTSVTKSLYFSENWSPVETLNLAFSGRYNHTVVENRLAPSIADSRLENLHLLNRYPWGVVCPGTDLSQCPYFNGPIPADVYWNELVRQDVKDQISGHGANALDRKQSEGFSYRSLNPALGITWQAKPNLNLYANWNQGTRAPSVIELGCAYDSTPAENGMPRSIVDGRGCKLPSALSGDPYLPQVKAQTMEVGARGKFKDFLEWNVSAYRTDVKDDIYLTSVTNELSFFQDIGDTRRQGIEFGLAGEYGKSDFRMNYSLTEATFQSFFKTVSSNNSSRGMDMSSWTDFNMIQVHPGNVMPGVPFNNMNFNWGYKLTRDLKLNFSLVAHSRSYLRGNENNAHTPSPGRIVTDGNGVAYRTPDNSYAGAAPGYAVLNFNGRYDIGKGWAATLQVNNVLDKKYYTAGRLGLNPFAPSTIGAIGPGGFNYNSSEWISSQFISAGAPRGVWVALSYDFDASKKDAPPPSSTSMTEPDRLIPPPVKAPTAEELALIRTLDSVRALPVLNRKPVDAATQTAEQEVKASIEHWRQALAAGDAEAYLKAYASTYAPAGISHNQWAEQQRLRLVTEAEQSVETGEIMFSAQGKRIVALFNRKVVQGQQQQVGRKMLTFEQKEGQWQIVREHDLPATNQVARPVSSQTAPVSTNPPKPRPAKAGRTESLIYAEAR